MHRLELALCACVAVLIGCGSAPMPEQPESPKPSSPLAAPRPAERVQPAAAAPQATAQPAAATDIDKVLAYDPADPLANLEAADELDRLARGPQGTAKPPAGGCAVIDGGRRVWPTPGPAAIAAVGRGFVVAGYGRRDGREQLYIVHVPAGGLPQPITAFDIDPPHPRERVAPPGLAARDENDVTVAFTDGKGRLSVRRLRMGRGGAGAAAQIATGVDTRFAPAVAANQDRMLVAWTVGSTPMRVELVVLSLEGKPISHHDLTPQSMGASAPSFVAGASPPVLVAVDARAGFSPILRIDLGSDGTPQPATVALPLSMIATPPELAAASSSVGTYVAFAGLGSAATSAVGLVSISPIAGKPEALVKGTAYGQLHLAAAAAPRAVLFAADAPTQLGKEPPHEIHVHVVGIKGTGPAAVIRGPGSASHAAIARDEEGSVGLAFSSAAGVYVAQLRCDDS